MGMRVEVVWICEFIIGFVGFRSRDLSREILFLGFERKRGFWNFRIFDIVLFYDFKYVLSTRLLASVDLVGVAKLTVGLKEVII